MSTKNPNTLSMMIRLTDEATIESIARSQRMSMELHGGIAPKPTQIIRDAMQALVAIQEKKLSMRKPAPTAQVFQ